MYKAGKCKDCSYNGKLISGRCQRHYWIFRQKENEKKNAKKEIEPKKNPLIGKWFEAQKSQILNNCEECNASLISLKKSELWTICVAHIVPKRSNKYPSVATHPLNRMFFCSECHNRFDNKGISEIESFKSIQIIRKRFKHVYNSMSEKEKNKAEIEYEFLINNK